MRDPSDPPGRELSETARKPACARAPSTRVARRSENTGVIAPRTWHPAKMTRQTSSANRGGHRRANAAIRGAPIIIPTANAEVSRPAVPIVMSRSDAIAGSNPASMNSEVPMTKTARASM